MKACLLAVVLGALGCASTPAVPRWKAERIWGEDPNQRYYVVTCGYQKSFCFKRASDTCQSPWKAVSENDDSYSESHSRSGATQYFSGGRSDSQTLRQWSMMIQCLEGK